MYARYYRRIHMLLNMIALALLSIISLLHGEGFVEGTIVKTTEGYKLIQDIKANDYVLSLDAKKNVVTSRVEAVLRTYKEDWCKISLDGNKIIAHEDQKFYNYSKEKWVAAKDLKVGTFLLDSWGNKQVVSSEITSYNRDVYAYTLYLDKHHNFMVTEYDIVVHNVIPLLVWGAGGLAFAGWDAVAAGTFYTIGGIFAACLINKIARDAGADGGIAQDWIESASKIPPGYTDEWTKRRGRPGFVDQDGNIWTPDMKHRNHGPHWDVSDPSGNKIKEVNDDGTQIWPDGPKNKNKKP